MRFLRLWEGAFLATADLLGRTSQASVIDLRKQWRTLRDFLDTDSFLYNVQGSPSTCSRFVSIAIRPAPRVTEYFIVEEKYPKGIASRRCHLELKR